MQKPFVDISIAGTPSGLLLGGSLKEFTYRDVHHGEVDEISFKLADGSGLWRSAWAVDEGTTVAASIGYQGFGGLIFCGQYAVDEVESEGDASGDTTTFRALAAFTSKELRTDRTAAYDEMSLEDIVTEVAGRHALEVIGDIPELEFTRISQTKESDLAFLTRLATDWGCYFSVKGSTLVFTTRESIESAAPVRVFNLMAGEGQIRYRLRKSTHKLYKSAIAKYLDPKTKKVIEVEIADPRVPSGDILKIDDKVETQRQAERLCAARLAAENDKLGTGSITLVGSPSMVAGQVILLGPRFGKYTGLWLVTMSDHKVASVGYTTTINVKSL